jgi:hypothetical protein
MVILELCFANVSEILRCTLLIHKRIDQIDILYIQHEKGCDFILTKLKTGKLFYNFSDEVNSSHQILLLNFADGYLKESMRLTLVADPLEVKFSERKEIPNTLSLQLSCEKEERKVYYLVVSMRNTASSDCDSIVVNDLRDLGWKLVIGTSTKFECRAIRSCVTIHIAKLIYKYQYDKSFLNTVSLYDQHNHYITKYYTHW